MTGTIRLGKGARREAGSEESHDEIADSTFRKRIQGLAARVNRQPKGKPKGHSERCGVNPTGLPEEGESYLRRSPFWSVHTGLPRQQCSGTGTEKSAEPDRAKGRIL
jgi:hypothetical protein